jgi:hypothetical protein
LDSNVSMSSFITALFVLLGFFKGFKKDPGRSSHNQ